MMKLKEIQKLSHKLSKRAETDAKIVVLREKQMDFVNLRNRHKDLMDYYDDICREIANELVIARRL